MTRQTGVPIGHFKRCYNNVLMPSGYSTSDTAQGSPLNQNENLDEMSPSCRQGSPTRAPHYHYRAFS